MCQPAVEQLARALCKHSWEKCYEFYFITFKIKFFLHFPIQYVLLDNGLKSSSLTVVKSILLKRLKREYYCMDGSTLLLNILLPV